VISARSPQNSSRFLIRPAISGDEAEIISIANAAFAIETFLGGTRTDPDRLAGMKKKGEILVAESDGRIVACVYVELRGTRGYFGMLAVTPQAQGTGLGRTMVEAAEKHCRERACTDMDITVLNLRPELFPYYRKLGYSETGTEEFHPTRPVKSDADCYCIVMSKKL
jgi:ribosomal protein S18 acetylase RimI-like enzyme